MHIPQFAKRSFRKCLCIESEEKMPYDYYSCLNELYIAPPLDPHRLVCVCVFASLCCVSPVRIQTHHRLRCVCAIRTRSMQPCFQIG